MKNRKSDRIKAEKVDVCAACSWRGAPEEWQAHYGLAAHQNAVTHRELKEAGYVPLDWSGPRSVRTFAISAADVLEFALKNEQQCVHGHEQPGLVMFEPWVFVRREVQQAINTYFELPQEARKNLSFTQYIEEMFADQIAEYYRTHDRPSRYDRGVHDTSIKGSSAI